MKRQEEQAHIKGNSPLNSIPSRNTFFSRMLNPSKLKLASKVSLQKDVDKLLEVYKDKQFLQKKGYDPTHMATLEEGGVPGRPVVQKFNDPIQGFRSKVLEPVGVDLETSKQIALDDYHTLSQNTLSSSSRPSIVDHNVNLEALRKIRDSDDVVEKTDDYYTIADGPQIELEDGIAMDMSVADSFYKDYDEALNRHHELSQKIELDKEYGANRGIRTKERNDAYQQSIKDLEYFKEIDPEYINSKAGSTPYDDQKEDSIKEYQEKVSEIL